MNAPRSLATITGAGDSATGELRFETAGAVTDQLMRRGSTTLRVGGRSVAVRFTTP